jgi:heterodisulfide reductase subunit C/nitrate reductase gamma subunit
MITIKVALFQSKIFRRPVIGFMHALVFWGFCVIAIGSIEMVIDGVSGSERIFSSLGWLYDIITASGDVFALLVLISIVVFLIRRVFMHIRRFEGVEMKKKSHQDANIALSLILLLMVSLLGMNVSYLGSCTGEVKGVFPVSQIIVGLIGKGEEDLFLMQIFWWMHILLIFLFANILPYSKHFHVFMSIPNVFFSRLEPLGKLPLMENVLKEVKMMMNPETAFASAPAGEEAPARFGVKDVEDVNRKNYLDALSCTECGRCTSVCPANITGKKLSPRKIFMDLRARMKEKGPGLLKEGKSYDDKRSFVNDYIIPEELWACTTCNACAQECPVNINHPTLIIDMRRYLVMEEGNAPAGIKSIFANIENNGAPWQFSPEDRMKWAE